MSGNDTICNWIYVLKYLSRDFRPGSKSVMQKEAAALYRPPKVRPKNLTIGGRYFYG